MPNWTKEQEEVIASISGNVLVSAGAGSGKTAVLTERNVNLICNHGAKLEDLLVLTFTNKAANEMKERIREAISKVKPEYLPDVETASIKTFDSFALELVNKYRYSLGLDREVSIIDDTLLEAQRYLMVSSLMEKHYQAALKGEDDDWLSFIRSYCLKDDRAIQTFILQVDSLSDLQNNPDAFLDSYEDEFFSDKKIAELNNQFMKCCYERFYQAKQLVLNTYPDEMCGLVDLDCATLDKYLAQRTYDDLKAFYASDDAKFVTVRKNMEDVGDADMRKIYRDKKIKPIVKKVSESLIYASQKEMEESYRSTRPYIRTVISIVKELRSAMKEYKRRYASYSFSDIFNLAIEALEQPSINQEIRARYKYIMVDEYQDTSILQDKFLSLIEDNNVFAVGDIKQSIYRFRHAEPKLFMDKFNLYAAKPEKGKLLTLSKNFRSREGVLKEINHFFQDIMTKEVGGVDYANKQALVFGNDSFSNSEHLIQQPLEVLTYEIDPTLGGKDAQEAALIANDIQTKLNAHYPVYDKDLKTTRACRPSDFAILIATKYAFPEYQLIFNQYSIPLQISDSAEASHEDVIILIKSFVYLLCDMNTPFSEKSKKHHFASLARSFAFQIPDDTLFASLEDNSYKKMEEYRKIEDHKDELLQGNLADSIEWFLNEFDVFSKLTLIGDVKENYARIQTMLTLAKQTSLFQWKIEDMAHYFESLKENEIDYDIETNVGNIDAVKLMSIHASKGLQFKIVYFPSLRGKFSKSKLAKGFVSNDRFGLLLPDPRNGKSGTCYHKAADYFESQEELSEKMRLFYVALTRAEEKMILVMNETQKIPASRIQDANSFSDFIALANLRPNLYHHVDFPLPEIHPFENSRPNDIDLEFRHIDPIVAKANPTHHASKEAAALIDLGSLQYGTRMHRLLELVDFKSKDTSWIASKKEKEHVDKVLSLPLFEHSELAKSYHEYRYLDENGQEGSIDLLMVYPDHIEIIDYKSSNIDDPHYDDQLKAYKSYIEDKFKGKKIKMILLSIKDARIREVK